MDKRRLSGNSVIVAGVILFLLGFAHNILSIIGLNEAISNGEVNLSPISQVGFERMSQEELMLTWVLTGLFMNLLGLLLISFSSEVKKGKRSAWSRCIMLGLFFLILGVVTAFYFKELHPAVLSFPLVGLLLFLPLLIYRKEFSAD